MRIAIDLDGVVVDLMQAYCRLASNKFNIDFATHNIRDYDLYKSLGVSSELANSLFKEIDYTALAAIDGAVDSILRLSEQYDLFFLTQRPQQVRHATKVWLNKHNLAAIELVFVCDNRAGAAKKSACGEFDLLIDDDLDEILALQPGQRGILYNWPWNNNFNALGNLTIAQDWLQIEALFLKNGPNKCVEAVLGQTT